MQPFYPALNYSSEYTPNQLQALNAAFSLARTCQGDQHHISQVVKLSMRLFDDLQSLHNAGSQERFWLQTAAILHDIGWVQGRKSHHKTTLEMILTTPLLPFENRERYLVGSIARYHRKTLPSLEHDHFRSLNSDDQILVNRMAALLRIADGLDQSHKSLIQTIVCEQNDDEIILRCAVHSPAKEEKKSALKKSDLFEQTYGKRIKISWIISL